MASWLMGGLFFRARDPASLAQWYRDHLGISLVPANYDDPPWQQVAGPTAFAPFPESTDYFGDGGKIWMIDVRVRNPDAMAAQLRAAGISWQVRAHRIVGASEAGRAAEAAVGRRKRLPHLDQRPEVEGVWRNREPASTCWDYYLGC